VQLQLGTDTKTFDVEWFDPRIGGGAQTGTLATVTGPGLVSLGSPPYASTSDWAVRVSVPAVVSDAPPLIADAFALALGPDLGVAALVQDTDGGGDIATVEAWFFAPNGTYILTLPMAEFGNDVWGLLLQNVPAIPSGTWPIAVKAIDTSGQSTIHVELYNQP
jgi:hypothetical protein